MGKGYTCESKEGSVDKRKDGYVYGNGKVRISKKRKRKVRLEVFSAWKAGKGEGKLD